MFEAYKIGIKVALLDNVTHGLSAMAARFASTDIQANKLKRTLSSISKMSIGGGVLMGGGLFGLKMLEGPIAAATQFELAARRFENMNLGSVVNKQAIDYARGMKGFAVSSVESLDSIREVYGLLNNVEASDRFKISTKLAELNKANAALYGISEDGASQSVTKFADIRGKTNSSAEFDRSLDIAQKLVVGSGGAIKFNDLKMMAQHGGAAFRGLSDEGLLNLASAVQEKGGAKTATSLMSAYQNMVAGRMTQKAMHEWEAIGLGKISRQQIGEINGKPQYSNKFDINGEFGKLFLSDPVSALYKYVKPAIESKYGKLSDGEMMKKVNDLLSNRNSSDLAGSILTQEAQTRRDALLSNQAAGAEQTREAYKNSMQGKMDNYNAKMFDFQMALGRDGGVLDMATKALDFFSNALQKMTNFAKEHPMLMKFAMYAFAATSALAVLGGGLMLFVAAVKAMGLVGSVLGFKGKMGGGGAIAGKALGAISGAASLYAMAHDDLDAGAKGQGKKKTLMSYAQGAMSGAAIGMMFGPIGAAVGAVAGLAYTYVVRNWSAIKKYTVTTFNGVKTYLAQVWNNIGTKFNEQVNKFKSYGSMIIDGLKNGLMNAWDGLTSWFKNAASGLSSIFKKALGIQSPSRVFMGHGGFIVDGLVLGLNQNAHKAHAAIGNLTAQPRFNTIATGKNGSTHVHTSVNLDGRVVAQVVTKHQARDLNRPMSGGTRFDGFKAMPHPAMGY